MSVLAAVDIGSNSVRLKIAKLSHSRLQTLHEDREVTRLGDGVFRNGYLSPEAIANTAKALERFRRACTRFRADQVRVVATSATRDARNSREFADWVRRSTGWKLEVISGLEEGRLIHLGVMANTHNLSGAKRLLFFDLGGGSCEITLAEERHILQVFSLPLGVVRLTQEFISTDPPTAPELRRMHDYVREELVRIANTVCSAKPELTIATSGTAAALSTAARAFSTGKRPRSQAGLTSRDAALKLLDELSIRTEKESAALPGINPNRAQIIIAGAMVFAELLRSYDLPGFLYSPLGLRDGLLAQMAAELDAGTREYRHIEAEREDAVLNMCKRYQVDLRHAIQVRHLSSELFTTLKTLHKMPAENIHFLAAAAMLHECGYYVNRQGRHRHSWYLIVHSEIFGFDPYERLLIAAVARYMGKLRPSAADQYLRLLTAEDRQAIPRMVALLRLARALNQSRKAAVSHVSAHLRSKTVTLDLVRKSRSGGSLETWAAEKEQDYFYQVFGRELRLRSNE